MKTLTKTTLSLAAVLGEMRGRPVHRTITTDEGRRIGSRQPSVRPDCLPGPTHRWAGSRHSRSPEGPA